MRNALLIYVFMCGATAVLAQNAVRKSFEFLQVPSAARLSALGGVNVSLADRDINFVQYNPSLVSDSLAGVAAVNYQFYLAGIGHSSIQYVHKFRRLGVFSFGVRHLNYGTIEGFDATGMEMGEFKAHETVIAVGKTHQISRIRMGATMKVAFSNLAGYRASALLFDVGATFIHPNKRFTAGLSVRNAGFMLADYSPGNSTELPLDVQVGTTFKPEHMPIRFSFTAYRLAEPEAYHDSLSGNPEPSAFDQVFRHLNLAAEILVHRNVDLLVGYNYGIHQELKLEDHGGMAGLSLGFSVHIKAFEFTFSRSTYATGVAGYAFSLSQDLNHLMFRK